MDLTDDELEELHSILGDYVMYGEDSIVYTSEGDTAREIFKKVHDEAKKRDFWWAN